MQQSKLGSLYEAAFNIAIGFSINWSANVFLIPLFADDGHGGHAHLSMSANWWMGCVYTVISLIRQFVIRRWFNAKLHAAALRLAGVAP